MVDIANQKKTMIDSVRIFGGSVFAHTLPEILIKHNIKVTDSKRSIWDTFYITKGEGLGGS